VSTLTDRLRGIVGGAVPHLAPELQTGRDEAARRLGPPSAHLPESVLAGAARAVGGRVATGTSGAVILVDRHYAASERHGRVPIGTVMSTLLGGQEALRVLTRAWPASARGPTGPSDASHLATGAERVSGVWFLDLETTGLAGGAGTHAFLVGCAHLEAGGLSVRQFLLPGYEHERALLAEVAGWAASRGALVTFNGKSFDVPLIETRYLFHRVPFPLDTTSHVDMLHPARRLWRARGAVQGSLEANCSLGTLERLLAGVHRVGDVPGFEIPSRYFQFVRSGDAHPLEAVLEHNRLDLVSLAMVLARVLTLVERGPAATADPYECLGLARLYDRAGRADDADAAYVRAIERLEHVGRDPESCGEALRRLAWCRRRAGRAADATDAWQRLADLPRCPPALRREAREALAIHHEHRARDLEQARAHAERLLTEQPGGRWREAAEHRLRRIERKLERQRPPAGLWPEV